MCAYARQRAGKVAFPLAGHHVVGVAFLRNRYVLAPVRVNELLIIPFTNAPRSGRWPP